MSGPKSGPFLPEELLWEILSRVPVKALMRFRCVCKSWDSLIFDPTFVKLHLQKSSTNTTLLYTSRKYDAGMRTFSVHCSFEPLLDNPSFIIDNYDGRIPLRSRNEVIGVCNGLVCLATTTLHECEFERVWVQFWNPATRFRSQKSCIIETPRCSYLMVTGFGYDDSNDTYKVVAVYMNRITMKTEVIVHCMGNTCFKKVASWSGFSTLLVNTATMETDGLYVAGTLNWIEANSVKTGDKYSIFSFDLRNETYRYYLLPRGVNIHIDQCSQFLGVLRGCMCFVHYVEAAYLSVFQMKEFGSEESWTMLFKFDFLGPQIFTYSFPLCMNENGDVLLLNLDHEGFQLMMYNRRDDILEKIRSVPNNPGLKFFEYYQSLVLPSY